MITDNVFFQLTSKLTPIDLIPNNFQLTYVWENDLLFVIFCVNSLCLSQNDHIKKLVKANQITVFNIHI
jgi:hypothetical protein